MLPKPSSSNRLAIALAVAIGGVALVVPRASAITTTNSASAPAHSLVARTTVPGTGCPVFPVDNVWNTAITSLPVNPHSAVWLASMGSATTNLHPDYGPSGNAAHPYGIPWNLVSA